jgi:hypothetical protein
MIKDEFVDDLNVNNKLGYGGSLVKCYAELLKFLW